VQLADQVGARNADILEEHLVEPGIAGHLHERTHRDAGRLHVDQDVGDATVLRRLRVGADETEHPVGVLRPGGPDLLAVHDELVPDDRGARAERCEIGARAGLGVSLTPDVVGGEDPRQVSLPLLLGAVRDERRSHHLDAHHADQPRGPRANHLLVDDGLAHDVGTLAAVLGGPAHGEVARLEHLPLPRLGARDLLRVGRPLDGIVAAVLAGDVRLEPRAHLALEGEFLGRVGEIHRRRRLPRSRVPWLLAGKHQAVPTKT
jgi:hypothetical protein